MLLVKSSMEGWVKIVVVFLGMLNFFGEFAKDFYLIYGYHVRRMGST